MSNTEIAERYFLLGIDSFENEKYLNAQFFFKKSLEEFPNRISTLINLSSTCIKLKQFNDAIFFINQALSIESQNEEALNNLAFCYWKLDLIDDAIKLLNKVLKKYPKSSFARCNLAEIYSNLGLHQNSNNLFNSVINSHPFCSEAYIGLSNLYIKKSMFKESLSILNKASKALPENDKIKFNLALILIRLSYYKQGWQLYSIVESKNISNEEVIKNFNPIKKWHGENEIKGHVLFVIFSQGYGDCIQFIRFINPVKNKFKISVIIYVPKNLRELIQFNFPDILVVDSFSDIFLQKNKPSYYCYGMELIYFLNLKNKSISFDFLNSSPYIKCCNTKLNYHFDINKINIGLVWKGSGQYANEISLRRDIPTELIVDFLNRCQDLTNLLFHTLTVGLSKEDLFLTEGISNLIRHGSQKNENFVFSAFVLSKVNFVISVDTASCHLAGAMGIETIILLPTPSDYLWPVEGSHANWYPSSILLRQTNTNEWSSVLNKLFNLIAVHNL